MTALTLPGTIPDLLRRGSPVIEDSRAAVYLGADKHGYHYVADLTPGMGCGHRIAHEPVHLDLTDATGRAHAAWWLALRECPASHVLDPAAVAWHPAPAQADAGWALEWQARAIKGCGTLTGHWWSGRSRSPVPTRMLWHLVRDDDTRLPDGSRWVDAEALRLVCLHVAGVSA